MGTCFTLYTYKPYVKSHASRLMSKAFSIEPLRRGSYDVKTAYPIDPFG
ncbi:MAG: hypothetical protein DRJ67_11035 [Thermoprotei archaeon]|nr:MAG: hypothetical protein DRJ67_11035 [Thermoprotei archaeon]